MTCICKVQTSSVFILPIGSTFYVQTSSVFILPIDSTFYVQTSSVFILPIDSTFYVSDVCHMNTELTVSCSCYLSLIFVFGFTPFQHVLFISRQSVYITDLQEKKLTSYHQFLRKWPFICNYYHIYLFIFLFFLFFHFRSGEGSNTENRHDIFHSISYYTSILLVPCWIMSWIDDICCIFYFYVLFYI